jgi:hypothetical protein
MYIENKEHNKGEEEEGKEYGRKRAKEGRRNRSMNKPTAVLPNRTFSIFNS